MSATSSDRGGVGQAPGPAIGPGAVLCPPDVCPMPVAAPSPFKGEGGGSGGNRPAPPGYFCDWWKAHLTWPDGWWRGPTWLQALYSARRAVDPTGEEWAYEGANYVVSRLWRTAVSRAGWRVDACEPLHGLPPSDVALACANLVGMVGASAWTLARVDLAVDVPEDIRSIDGVGFCARARRTRELRVGGVLQTKYWGHGQLLARVYDRAEKLRAAGREPPDGPTTRVEFQLRRWPLRQLAAPLSPEEAAQDPRWWDRVWRYLVVRWLRVDVRWWPLLAVSGPTSRRARPPERGVVRPEAVWGMLLAALPPGELARSDGPMDACHRLLALVPRAREKWAGAVKKVSGLPLDPECVSNTGSRT